MKDTSAYNTDRPRVAIVLQGMNVGGGVPTVARWLRDGLKAKARYDVDIFDLATSSHDMLSRRLASPRTWARRSLSSRRGTSPGQAVERWGANFVELEFMRYRPRREFTRRLDSYDVIQVVCGGPALAYVASRARRPTVLQVATRVAWEREASLRGKRGLERQLRRIMTSATSRIEEMGLDAAGEILVENQFMLRHLRGLGYRNVHFAPPGVDTNRFTPRPEGWNNSGNLLSVCRFGDPRKGLPRLIAAYSLAVKEQPTIPNLTLVGRGRVPDDLKELVVELELQSRVDFREGVNDDELPVLYREASMYVQASYEEGLGLSVLEAMSSGIPVVSTETAGTSETVVTGTTGRMVPQLPTERVIASLASAIVITLEEHGEVMGSAGRERCTQLFSSERNIEHFTKIYEELLGDWGRADGHSPGTRA